MKTAGWFVAIATIFYVSVVMVFWPFDKTASATNQPKVSAEGYGAGNVEFSDTSVHVRIPTTATLQERGLAGQTRLSDADGMLWNFVEPQRPAFWMKGMLIPLDFIWMREGMVVEVTQNVQAPENLNTLELPVYEPNVQVDAVLEVAAGFVQRHAVQIGDSARLDIK